MFNPGSGWFRRLERWISHNLCLSVFPHFPGMTLPYNRQLRRSLTLSEAEVAIPGLDPAFDGLKVLLATDIHAGPFASPQAIEDAFSRLLTVSPDLILLDWNMPRMDGLAFLEAYRAGSHETPVIMVTTEAERPRVIEAIKAGVNNYVVKPFTPEILSRRIEETIEKSSTS